MIGCDFCKKKIERTDEHDLVLWTVFRKVGFKLRFLIESVPGPNPEPVRHICPACKFKILDAVMKKPLSEPPQAKAKAPPPAPTVKNAN